MALDERYMTTVGLDEYIIDPTTGLPATGGTIEFWTDNSRVTPKLVYEISGSPPNYTYSALPNPMSINSVGNPVNAGGDNVTIYYFPYDVNDDLELYYIVVKDSSGTIILQREAWPNISTTDDPTAIENSITNEIDNSQFVDVLFNPTYGMVITETGSVSGEVYEIAPYWDLVISTNGAATVTINRTEFAGSLNITTNPPYSLDILTSGANISSLKLRQRLTNNPDIWSTGFIAGHAVISSVDGTNHTLELQYAPSVAPSATTIVSGNTGTSGYSAISATVELDAGTNTDAPDVGYIDILIVLPTVGNYNVTSIQVVGLSSNEQGVIYDQQTANRQRDLLFGYYNPYLQAKPQDSCLIGWNFATNPRQFGTAVTMPAAGANTSAYILDQTIGFQSTTSSYSTALSSIGYLVLIASATTKVALVQYLSVDKNRELYQRAMLHNDLSVQIRGYSMLPGDVSLPGTVSMWATTDANLPDLNTNASIVATLDANGKPATFNGTWVEITRDSLGDGKFTLDAGGNNRMNIVNINRFKTTDVIIGTAKWFAIVVGFGEIDAADEIHLDYISVVKGTLAAPPNPQSYDQVLEQCQYYYESSYQYNTLPGATTTLGQLVSRMVMYAEPNAAISTGTAHRYLGRFMITFNNTKRVDPTVTLYSPSSATPDQVLSSEYKGATLLTQSAPVTNPESIATTPWDITPYLDRVLFLPNTTTVKTYSQSGTLNQYIGSEGIITYHYVADARLGIV